MSRIFLSHSSANNAEAIAVRDWMRTLGWDDVFLDLDPQRGLAAGDRWQAALRAAVDHCELVIFIVSPEWAASSWCKAEFLLTKHGSNPKAILPVIVSPTPFSALPSEMTAEYQSVDLTAGTRSVTFTVNLPPGDKTVTVAFSEQGLQRLRIGIERTGIDAKHFAWPPESDPNRPPYRGLAALEADDAGIFFGRDAQVIAALDQLRGLCEAAPPRLLVILGASGAGKSSFMRAGLLSRLARDDRHFLPLPVIRPERAVLSGEAGLLRSLEAAVQAAKLPVTRADLRSAIGGGMAKLQPLLQTLVDKITPAPFDTTASPKPPTLILAVDQVEELFLPEGEEEARPFLALLRDLLAADVPGIIGLFTIRSDNYERLQLAPQFEGIRKIPFDLGPIPKGSYAEVIKGPALRLEGTPRALKVDDTLVQALLNDIEAGGAKDSLPLIAFTLERLYGEYRAGGHLKLEQYYQLGGIAGSIEAAVEQAFKAADADPRIPRDRQARFALLRRGLIPWVAGIDADTGAPRRRVARLSEIPAEARPLMDLLVDQRLLSTDVSKNTGEKTVEPAHEALLRQWGLLQGWLRDDSSLLSIMDGVKRASRDWAANARSATWLTHTTDRLNAAGRVLERVDLAAHLEPTDRDYLAACHERERATAEKELSSARTRQRLRALASLLMICMIVGLIGWINQAFLKEQWNWFTVMRPYMLANVRPYVLKEVDERALKPQASFRECAVDCPLMIVIPAGTFMMGSPQTEKDRNSNEGPRQHQVTIAKPFAVSKFDVTFADWDACVSIGGCDRIEEDSGFGRSTQPVINVSWDQAQQYAAWLSRMTGQRYRLLSEAEWEYAARAGAATAYHWGDEIGQRNANCDGCGSKFDKRQASPVGSFKPNAFGLHDMSGNVFQWVQDCYRDGYDQAPTDGSAFDTKDCRSRVLRGGSWESAPRDLRLAHRDKYNTGDRDYATGFRVARTLSP